jgi:hypothetical protein
MEAGKRQWCSWAAMGSSHRCNRVEPTEVLDRICRDACAVSVGCIEDGSVCPRPAFSFQVRLIQAAEPGSLRGDEPRPASLRGRLLRNFAGASATGSRVVRAMLSGPRQHIRPARGLWVMRCGVEAACGRSGKAVGWRLIPPRHKWRTRRCIFPQDAGRIYSRNRHPRRAR